MAAKTFLSVTLAILGLLFVLGASAIAGGRIIYVDDDGPADFSNIQAAIDAAVDGDIIIVNPGTYTGEGNRDIDFKGKAITVRGTDPGKLNIIAATVIDCEGSDEDYHRGFYFHSGEDENSILEGLKITNGLHSTGAGICCLESSPTIRNNIITGNETGFDEDGGAGIGCWYGASPTIANNIISDNICAAGGGGGGICCYYQCSPTITNCTISRNSPGGINIYNSNPTISNCTFEGNLGGGVSTSSLSSPIFINCTFIGNSSPTGGGMHIYESNPTLINCSFIQNVATTRGGGLNIYGWDTASPTLINCTFAGNSAGNYGGGMYCRDNTNSMLVNCTFTGNSAEEDGGAVYNYGYDRSVRITLNNCTFSGNLAANGNDLACDSPYGPPSYVQVTNCVIWDGENPIWNNDGSTITITYSDVHGGWPGRGNIDTDPCFVDPDGDDDILGTEDDNLRLLRNSPCIDAGDPNYLAGPNESDLDGKPRVIAGRIDMGAYEFQSHLILYVDADATGANDGSSWADAFNFLQDALAVAYSGDEIRVARGIYKPDQGAGIAPGDREATFQLINGVTIKGGYAGAGEPDPNARDIELYETILSGDLADNDVEVTDAADLLYEESREENSFHVVEGSETEPTAILDGFLVVGGQAWSDEFQYLNEYCYGGGLYIMSGSPTVRNCRFMANTALSYGGGVHMDGNSTPVFVNCGFSGNSATDGGGLNNDYGSPILTGCTFSGNAACSYNADGGFGGGMYNFYSNSKLIDCTFTENSSDEWGGAGGMRNNNSSVIVTNCTFTNNSGGRVSGGGMLNDRCSLILTNCRFIGNSTRRNGGGMCSYETGEFTLDNCIFIGNSAEERGGGMCNSRNSPTLTNCTFSGNSADNCGGGMYNGGSSGPKITNCIFWGDAPEEINFDSGTIDVTYNDIQGGWPGQGNIDADPCFIELGYWDANGIWFDGDYHLLQGSLCIDAGDPNYVSEPNETDLDGDPRIINGRVDMGAYEYSPTISAEVRILPRTINLASKGKSVTCYIWLPDDYDVADIVPSSVLLEQQIKAEQFSVDEHNQVATATFDREKVRSILNVGDIELTITGRLTDGTFFEAKDIIKVVDKAGLK